MKKSLFPVTLILLLLAGLVLAAGVAGQEEVVINVGRDGLHYDVYPGQVAVLRAGWGACAPGLVRAFIKGSNWTVTLDGGVILTPDDVDGLWGPVEVYDDPPAGYDRCIGVARPARAEWRYTLLPGDAPSGGPYVLETQMRLLHPFSTAQTLTAMVRSTNTRLKEPLSTQSTR